MTKKEELIKRVLSGIAVLGIIGCCALLFPQVRQIVISIGGRILGKNFNGDVWQLSSVALVWLGLCVVILAISSSRFRIPPISGMKKTIILKIICVILICLYLFLLIFLALSDTTVWIDEVWSLIQIQGSWKNTLYLTIQDYHPPLYFFILKTCSLIFGNSIGTMRLVSVFPIILMIIVVSQFLRNEFSDKAALVFLLSCFAHKHMAYHSTCIRMYGWAIFFVAMMFVSAWYFFKSGKVRWWGSLLFCAVGAAYTHNFAAIAAGIGYLLLLGYVVRYRRDKVVALLLLAFSGVVLYSPWILPAWGQISRVSDGFWIPPLTIKRILGCVVSFFFTGDWFTVPLLFLVFCLASVPFLVKKNKTEKELFICGGACCVALTIVFSIVVSIVGRPVLVSRYLTPLFGLVWIFFAVVVSTTGMGRGITTLIYAVLLMLGLQSSTLAVRDTKTQNRRFCIFRSYIMERIQPDDILFVPSVGGSVATDFEEKNCLHMTAILKYLFPDYLVVREPNTTPAEDSGGSSDEVRLFDVIFGNSIVNYEPGLFSGRTVWTIVVEMDRSNTIVPEGENEFCGVFGWSVYRFKLFRSKS